MANTMSGNFIRFIPENINFNICENTIEQILNMDWNNNVPTIHLSEQLLFADAWQYFESAKWRIIHARY